MLIRLSRASGDADSIGVQQARKRLACFLHYGIAPWYGRRGCLHTTIASGLEPTSDELDTWRGTVWPEVRRRPGTLNVSEVLIMGEGRDRIVDVRYFDSFTQAYVEEKRTGLRIIERAPLSP
jgi:hypothetical protein